MIYSGGSIPVASGYIKAHPGTSGYECHRCRVLYLGAPDTGPCPTCGLIDAMLAPAPPVVHRPPG